MKTYNTFSSLILHLVMMNKYSKFGVDTFFWVMGYIKVFAWCWQQQRQQSNDRISSTFSSKQTCQKCKIDCLYLCLFIFITEIICFNIVML